MLPCVTVTQLLEARLVVICSTEPMADAGQMTTG